MSSSHSQMKLILQSNRLKFVQFNESASTHGLAEYLPLFLPAVLQMHKISFL